MLVRETDLNELHICLGFRRVDVDTEEREEVTVGNSIFQTFGKKSVWKIFGKVAFQSKKNIMQCDYDIDWDMPYNPGTGDVFDTEIEICGAEGPVPDLKECAGIAEVLNGYVPEAFKALKELEEKQHGSDM